MNIGYSPHKQDFFQVSLTVFEALVKKSYSHLKKNNANDTNLTIIFFLIKKL